MLIRVPASAHPGDELHFQVLPLLLRVVVESPGALFRAHLEADADPAVSAGEELERRRRLRCPRSP